jgi:hypothetical protein
VERGKKGPMLLKGYLRKVYAIFYATALTTINLGVFNRQFYDMAWQ